MLKEIENAFAQLIDVGSMSLIQKGRLNLRIVNNVMREMYVVNIQKYIRAQVNNVIFSNYNIAVDFNK